MAFLRRRQQRLRQQNSAQDTSPHQLLIELYTFWRVLSTIEYRIEYRKKEVEKWVAGSTYKSRKRRMMRFIDYGSKV